MTGGNKGFTLMEMLVAVAIFSMVTVAASNIYILATRTQRKVAAALSVAGTAKSVLERISRDIRTGRIDYPAYSGALAVQGENLMLRDESGEQIAYRRETDPAACLGGEAPCVVVQSGETARAIPAGLAAERLTFIIAPTEDPYDIDEASGTYPSDLAPRVTIILSLRDRSDPEAAAITFQTTVVGRTYVR